MKLSTFKESQLEAIVRILAEAVSHREVGALLRECGIEERGGTPRWERILLALSHRQRQDGCGNNVAAFIQVILRPSRFTERAEEHADLLEKVNQKLAFEGLSVADSGLLKSVEKASTITEAQARASHLRQELFHRKIHQDVLAFCRAELLQDNYFHAVLEATKSVAEKIRQRTGLASDGAELVDAAFSGNRPILALNSLATDAERSEQRGFVNIIKGFFGTFRNPAAHAPKIYWPINEPDAVDLLTIASYLHRRIDKAIVTRWAQ